MNTSALYTSRITWLPILIFVVLSGCSPSGIVETQTPDSPCRIPDLPHNSIILRTPSPRGATIMKDEGKVCFQAISPNKLHASVYPLGCYSSSCTVVFERTGRMEVHQNTYEIEFRSRYVVMSIFDFRNIKEGCLCSLDCGGAGHLEYETDDLKEGVYTVRLGRAKIGEVLIPFQHASVCLDTETTATPIKPTSTATQVPTPYPPPLATTASSPFPEQAYPPPGEYDISQTPEAYP
jgi:hypothetical protein